MHLHAQRQDITWTSHEMMHFKMKFVKVPTHHFNKNLFVQKSCDALIGT